MECVTDNFHRLTEKLIRRWVDKWKYLLDAAPSRFEVWSRVIVLEPRRPYRPCIQDEEKGSSPWLWRWPKTRAPQECWSPGPTGICCEWAARLLPPYMSGSRHRMFGGVDLQRSHSGCSWAALCCEEDSAHSGRPPGHRSAPGCQAGAAEEEEVCGHVVGMSAPPWSSCVGSLDPRCHAGRSGRPSRPCRFAQSAAHIRCTLAVLCKTPPRVQSLRWRPKIRSYTWGSCTADSLSGRNNRQFEQKANQRTPCHLETW